MNQDENSDSDDLLGDLGNFDDLSDDDAEDGIMTDRPYRTAEKICFVPVDPFTIKDTPSNRVPNKAIIEEKQQHPNDPMSPSIDKTNKNIHFTKMDDDGNEMKLASYPNTTFNPHHNDYGPGQIELDYSDNDSDYDYEYEYDSYSSSDNEDHDLKQSPKTKKSVNFSSKDTGSQSPRAKKKPSMKRENISLRNLLTKRVSPFRPKEFDICLLVSSPLTIKSKLNSLRHPNKSKRMSRAYSNTAQSSKNEKDSLLEYIRNSLPDRLELQQSVRQTLVRRHIGMRYGHFTATCQSIQELRTFGGCKVLQFVAHCCNPRRDKTEYPQLCKSLIANGMASDCSYILLETEVGHQSDYDDDEAVCCFGKGVWYKAEDLKAMFSAESTQIDCIIALSPQHQRLTEVFKTLGYEYIIGVEAPSNNDPFSTTETSAFLDQFYAALLEQRSVSRAYYLSLQAALTSRGSVRGGNDNDPKYILHVAEQHEEERFIIFDKCELRAGEINDKSQHEKLPRTNLREPVRPFLGRSEYVLQLLKKLTDTQIVNVSGKELIGRASVVKSATRYLLQMGFFRGGCFVIDCKLQSKKYHKNENTGFNECVYDVLKSCGIDFRIQMLGEDLNETEEDIVDIPQMNGSHSYHDTQLSTPSEMGHYSQRSSNRFANLDKLNVRNNATLDSQKTEFGDPKTSPRSLFEYLENSIFYDQKPPSHEPFCFVILNMNHWHNGGDQVTEWITRFSQQLFKKEDSRIICTGKDTLNISNVSTLNMKSLTCFAPRKLAELFKYFCRDFESKFDPSLAEIEQHGALQEIFDGRPGMTKKVSQYVRYVFASNDMEESEADIVINLDFIAKNYLTSKYAANDITALRQMFKAGSTSVPKHIGSPRNSFQLNTEGHLSMKAYSTGTASPNTPKLEKRFFNATPADPAVLIADQGSNTEMSGIMPAGGLNAGGSPPVSSTNSNYMLYGYSMQPQYHQMYPQQHYMQQQQRPLILVPPPPPPPPPQQHVQQQYYNNMGNTYMSHTHIPPSSRLFQNNAAMQKPMSTPGGSQSLSQINHNYPRQNMRKNNNMNNMLNTTIVSTTLQTTYTSSNSNPSIHTNPMRYNESIETLKNTQKKQFKNGASRISDSVQNLFTAQKTPHRLSSKAKPGKQSFTFVISDANNKASGFSHLSFKPFHPIGTSTTDNLMPSHRLRNLNKSISQTPAQMQEKEASDSDSMEPAQEAPKPIDWSTNYVISSASNTTIMTACMFPRQMSIMHQHRRSTSVPGALLRSRCSSMALGTILDPDVKENKTVSPQTATNTKSDQHQSIQLLDKNMGHSLQFSMLTEVSVLNEETSVECAEQKDYHLIAFDDKPSVHSKNASFLMSPRQSVTDYEGDGAVDVTQPDLKGVQSAPLSLESAPLQNENGNDGPDNKVAMTECAIIGISHSYSARKIWLNSCVASNNDIARLQDLFPNLMQEFKRLTKCETRQPTLQQIELFFVKTGGVYSLNESLPFICADKFDKFFAWFRSMCSIIKDLRPMYNRAEDPLIGLFYGRNTAQETLEHKPEGTFVLRLASQQNGLAITYKNPTGKIQNVLLTRIANEMYKVGKSEKETLLFNLIRPWPKLKYLYTPNKLIKKKFLF